MSPSVIVLLLLQQTLLSLTDSLVTVLLQRLHYRTRGAIQQTDTYSLNGSTLTLGAAPVTGDDVEVRTIRVQTSSVNVKDHFQYVFQPSTTTSTFTGNDLNTNALSYDVGKLEVYWNGARLTNGLDYTATTGNSIVLLGDAATSGDTIVVNSFGTASLLRDINSTVLSSTDADQAVDTYNKVYCTDDTKLSLSQCRSIVEPRWHKRGHGSLR